MYIVRRAQSRINQATLESEMRDRNDTLSGRSLKSHPGERTSELGGNIIFFHPWKYHQLMP